MGDGVPQGARRDPAQARARVRLTLRTPRFTGPRARWFAVALVAASALAPGCRGDDAGPDDAPDPAEVTPATDPEPATPPPDRGGKPLVIDLKLENLSPLYKGFFAHAPFVEQLATDLAPHVRSRSATVKVVWDEPTGSGSIQLLVPDGEAPLADVGAGLAEHGRLDPAPLQPYVGALDDYRRALGERYDLRILSFEVALELWDPASQSRCLWPTTGGDAEALALAGRLSCRDPFGNTHALERDGDAWPAPLDGPRKGRRALLGALGQ